MSSKRKRGDSKGNQLKKMKIIVKDDQENRSESLPNEIQIQILAQVPVEKLPELRLVCSRWRNLTNSSEYGKLLCINAFGEGCIRLLQPASRIADQNPECYLVLKSVEGHPIGLDTLSFGMFLLRMMERIELICSNSFRTLFGKYKAQCASSKQRKRDAKLTDTELSFTNIAAVLKLKQTTSEYLTPMLLKLIPALALNKVNGIPLAKQACSLLTKTSFRTVADMTRAQYVNGCLDVLKICRLHLPVAVYPSLYYFVMHEVYYFFNEKTTSRVKASDVTQSDRIIFRKALIEMIRCGASKQPILPIFFKEYFKQPFGQCFMNLLEHSNPFKAALVDEIVPTCIDEFRSTKDWKVQMSSLAVSHVTDCSFKDYFPEKMKFALSALRNPQNHHEVRRAAFLGMFYRAARSKLGPLIPATSFDDVFNGTVDALIFLPATEKHIAITVLMAATFDYPVDLFTEDKLDVLHKNLFEFLSSPNSLQVLLPDEMHTVVKNILSVGWALKTKLKKYLPTYHAKVLNLIKMPELKHLKLAPEYWIAFYFDLGCFISGDFDAEAKSMIAAIEEGSYEGFSVRKSEFFARSEHAANYLSHTPCDSMKQVLGMFPPHILKPTAQFSLLSTVKLSPKQVPVTKDQWDTYVQSLKQADPKAATSYQTPVFKCPPASTKKVKKGVKFDVKDVNVVYARIMKQEMEHIDFDNVVMTILKYVAHTEDLDPALMQQALHVLHAYAMWGVINSTLLNAITVLLIKLKPHLNDEQTKGYLMMIATTLIRGSYLLHALPDLDVLVQHILKLITPIPVVTPELLIAILKLACCPVEGLVIKGSESVDSLAAALELMTTRWPRAAYHVLMSPVLAFLKFFRTGDKRENLHWFWQLRLYGLTSLALLHHLNIETVVSMLKEMFEAVQGSDGLLKEMVPKMKLLIELWERNRGIALLSVHNQYSPEMQHVIKNALIDANKLPDNMQFHSDLLF